MTEQRDTLRRKLEEKERSIGMSVPDEAIEQVDATIRALDKAIEMTEQAGIGKNIYRDLKKRRTEPRKIRSLMLGEGIAQAVTKGTDSELAVSKPLELKKNQRKK